MSDGVGLSIGATNLTGVVVGRTALTRSPVLTLYPHSPPEVGVPSENPNLTERGLIITDFVDRVGDPVGIVASDGSTHHADTLLADALRAMLLAVGRGRAPDEPVAVTYPAHWRPGAVEALRNALAALPEFHGSASLVPDATAALTALQVDPGLPTRGVIAVCDFGGTGSSVTLADAAGGFAPMGPTVRHTDFSGDFIDRALLTHVIDDLSAAGTIDQTGTSAIGLLTRLRGQCRGAKERLSTSTVTSLVAELPGHRTDVRLTRNELDDAIRTPLADFVGVMQETLDRSGVRPADLVAVASVGGGARMPIITTTLSEHFRVPVITTAQPELAAAIGGGLTAVRGTVEEGMTSMAVAPAVAAGAAAATQMSPEADAGELGSSTFRALAWSDADDIPDVAPSEPYDYSADGGYAADGSGFTDARPPMQFDHDGHEPQGPASQPWYRRTAVLLGVGAVAVLAAVVFAVLFVMRDDSVPAPAVTTAPGTTTATTAEAPPPPPPPPATQAPPPATQAPPPQTRTVTQQAPPPVTQTQAPPPPPPPPPPTAEPPPTPEPTAEPTPSPSPRPPWRPTAPYPTIPGLPWVPAPQLPQPAP